MKAHWKKTLLRLSIWLFAEALLTFLGIDDLADYSEFVFDKSQLEYTLSMSIILTRSI